VLPEHLYGNTSRPDRVADGTLPATSGILRKPAACFRTATIRKTCIVVLLLTYPQWCEAS
jgi:hypothetical protein